MMASKKRIALYQQILAGKPIRGPHVFFPLLNLEYQKAENTEFELFYIIKTDNIQVLLDQYPSNQLESSNVLFLLERNHRFKSQLETLDLLKLLIRHKISLLHIISFTLHDPIKQLRIIQKLKLFWSLKITLSITYNGYSTAFKSGYTGRFKKYIEKEKLFREIQFDGVYTWYENDIEWIEDSGIFRNKPLVATIQSRFCDTTKYYPGEKQKIIIWAGALTSYKRPQMFIDAIDAINRKNPNLLKGWKVLMLGDGELKSDLVESIRSANLGNLIELRPSSSNYHENLNESILHVATQEIDHFPSLVINEAMASGCAVIATNVGRAYLFVKENENGFLTVTDDSEGLTDTLIHFLSLPPAEWERLMRNSRKLCETVHTPENFIKGVDLFWNEVLLR